LPLRKVVVVVLVVMAVVMMVAEPNRASSEQGACEHAARWSARQ
jgi:hypothetical protein